MSRLLENKEYFLKTVKIAKLLYKEKKHNDCLLYIERLSYSAWYNFPGYYTSNAIESIIRNIASKTLKFTKQKTAESGQDKTLHIFSEISYVGGHSKLIFSWIENDKNSSHYLLSTWQDQQQVSEIAESYNYKINNNLFAFEKDLNILEKAQKIIETLENNDFRRIVLHIHPHDVIPSMVFSSEMLQYPVFFLNHAEHTYWLGAPVIDFLLQIRESNLIKDSKNRNIPVEDQFFLPIPVDESFTLKKTERKTFHILSIGRESKYEPNETYNFYEAALKIVEKFENVVFTIVGISDMNENRKKYQHERLILVHPTREINKYIEDADLYLEGFPIPSFTSLLEPAMAGMPFVLHYDPASVYKVFDDKKEEGIFYPESLTEWHQEVERIITDETYRKKISDLQQNYLKKYFSAEAWSSQLEKIKSLTKNKKHSVRTIPAEEKYLDGRDEELVSVIQTIPMNHYSYTGRLGFFSRLKVVILSLNNPAWVKLLPKKRTLRYLIGR
jgi:glycosyltransferase involved in cell wall biosynthesis